jgi:hypothetical protein
MYPAFFAGYFPWAYADIRAVVPDQSTDSSSRAGKCCKIFRGEAVKLLTEGGKCAEYCTKKKPRNNRKIGLIPMFF